jgi:UTP--glucose-1-phosphate uridylyltransferase
MTRLRKAVIPVAGFGTRMLPAAKAVPKELLPVLDRPTIQYVVEEAARGGVNDVLLITSRDKRAIEDRFDRNRELESRLKASGQEFLLSSIIELSQQVQIHCVRQSDPRGLGHAVAQAEHHVNGEPFICMLGDTLFSGHPTPARQLADAYAHLDTAIIGLEEVPLDKVGRYGVVGGEMIGEGLMRIDHLVEKPARDKAPSQLAIAARYVLTNGIFDCLRQTAAGKNGEIQLTDALKLQLAHEPIHGVVLRAQRHDIGNPIDWLKTNLLLASRDPALWMAIEPMLRELLH